MKTSEKALYLVVIVLLISVGALGWLLKKKSDTIVEKENIIFALTDTITITKNKLGQSVSKISQFETAKVKDFLAIQGLTGVNKQLQDQVKANKDRLGSQGSVTVFTTNTNVNATVPTTNITFKDTVRVGDTLKVYPEYKSNVSLGKWINANITSNKDSTKLSLGVVNEYTLVLGEEKVKGTGFLGIGAKRKSFSEVTNLNPYSVTPTLKTYQVKSTVKPKRISLGVQTGYDPLHKQYYMGVGLQYNILNLF